MTMEKFVYSPPPIGRGKAQVKLGRSDLLRSAVQIVAEGGENNLHSHTGNDGFWFVLQGRATFYESEDEVFAELGRYEGVLVPRNTPYWFESSGEEPLEILHVAAKVQDGEDRRVDLRDRVRAPSVRHDEAGS